MQASEFFEIVRVTLKKFHKNLLFPSVACSSYFGYFVQFSRCGSDLSVEIRFKHLASLNA